MVTVFSADTMDWPEKAMHSRIFSGSSLYEGPFNNKDWTLLGFGKPWYVLDASNSLATKSALRSRLIYRSLEQTLATRKNFELIAVLQEYPQKNPWLFKAALTGANTFYEMQQKPIDGFDLQIYSNSGEWGLVFDWDEENALLGGNATFIEGFVKRLGSIDELKKDVIYRNSYLGPKLVNQLLQDENSFLSKILDLCNWSDLKSSPLWTDENFLND